MDREIIFFTKGRLVAAHSIIDHVAAIFKNYPFVQHLKQALDELNKADTELENELIAAENRLVPIKKDIPEDLIQKQKNGLVKMV